MLPSSAADQQVHGRGRAIMTRHAETQYPDALVIGPQLSALLTPLIASTNMAI